MDVTLLPEIEKMVLDRVRSGKYSSTNELVNVAVTSLLSNEVGVVQVASRPDRRSAELAQDAAVNLQWLDKNRTAYIGEWVALHKGQLIAHGTNGLEVFQVAQARGINPPLMHRVTEEATVDWGGW